LKYLKKKWFKG